MFYSELHKSTGSDLANAKSILQLLPRSCKSMLTNFCELFCNACLRPLEEEGAVFRLLHSTPRPVQNCDEM